MVQIASAKVKSNKAFMILSALGILFVVDVHTGGGMGAFTAIFPYDSFFMPMFMFISGYFWKEETVENWVSVFVNFKRKFVKLMVPYLLWNVFYGLLIPAVNGLGMSWPMLTLRDFIYSLFTDGTTFGLNGAAWFVPTLFAVTVTYTVARKLLSRWWSDGAALGVFILLGAAAVALSTRPGGVYHKALLLYKTAFFIQFFQLGYYFKRKLETWFDRMGGLGLCLAMGLVNLLLLSSHETIEFGRCAFMGGFTPGSCFLPLITSVTGIFFWLKIAKALEPVLGGSGLVNYISSNTFFIMMHHLLFAQVFGLILWAGMGVGLPALTGFDPSAFQTDPWYLFEPGDWMKAAYFLFSITASVLACWLWDRTVQGIKGLRRKKATV